jgi:hypothetical protein
MLGFYRTGSGQRFEPFFGGTTNRAVPIVGQLFKAGSFFYLSSAIPPIRIIQASAVNGLTLVYLFRLGHRAPLIALCQAISQTGLKKER